jgi:hypothetical protein
MAIQAFATGNERGKVPGFDRTTLGPVKLYVSREAHPMVYAPKKWETLADPGLRLAAMRAKEFNPYECSILDEAPNGQAPASPQGRLEKLDLTGDGLNRQEYHLRLSSPGLMIFAEANFPGWTATQDGAALPIYTANHLYRGVFLDQGDHQVVFRYEPPCFRLALFLVMLCLGSWVPVCLKRAANQDRKTSRFLFS